MPQDENIVASLSLFNLEGQEFVHVTSDFLELTLLIVRREYDLMQ